MAKLLHTPRTGTYYKRKQSRNRIALQKRQKILDFLHRDDNSTCLPGKKDVKKVGKAKKQKRVLTDFIQNLHAKFCSEYPQSKVGLTLFKKTRPPNILPVHWGSRQTCLCTKHQNMSLLLRAVKKHMPVGTNPDEFCNSMKDFDNFKESMADALPDTVEFEQWEYVTVPHGKQDKLVKRIKLVMKSKPREEFVGKFQEDFILFKQHAQRAQKQFKEVKRLKESLPKNHMT